MRVAPRIEELVAKACRRKARERYQTAREVAAEIEAIARETNWVATHAEVAACIETLAGSALRRRRERIADALAHAEQAPEGRRVMRSAAPPPFRDHNSGGSGGEQKPEPAAVLRRNVATDAAPVVATPGRPLPRSALLLAGVLATAAIVATWLWRRSDSRSPAEDEAPGASPPAPHAGLDPHGSRPIPMSSPPPPVVLPAVPPSPNTAPESGAPQRPKPGGPTASPPIRAAPRPKTTSPPLVAPVTPVSPPDRTPPAPDGVTRKNPYRNP
jgi:hypothetical protein